MAILSEVEDVLRSLRDVWDEDAVDELVLASALHDLGHSPLFGDDWKQHHGIMARTWLTPRFGARVGWLAGAHVAAKVPRASRLSIEAVLDVAARVLRRSDRP